MKLSEEARKAKADKDKAKIQNYKRLTSDILQKRVNNVYTRDTLVQTTELLSLNPEFYTIWNYRREVLLDLFSSNTLVKKETLENDLKFVMAQLKRYPKCYWIWNHRVWCLLRLQESREANWDYELAIVSKLLDLDSRNYHGWQYRRFVMENIEEDHLKTGNEQTNPEGLVAYLKVNIKEFEYTTSKINKNISNFSAWHNRSKLIPKIYSAFGKLEDKSQFQEANEIFKSPYNILIHELELIKTGMYMDVEDTSIWLYLYWLLTDKFFVDDLSKNASKERSGYIEILQDQLELVEELNELEKSDHVQGWDNCWCLKSIILINGLIKNEEMGDGISSNMLLDDETKTLLEKLIRIDPLRKGRYLDQLEGNCSTISIA